MDKSREEMHQEFIDLGDRVKLLKGIVQNPGIELNKEEFYEWINSVHQRIDELLKLKKDVQQFYEDQGISNDQI
ncbi:hypothetical protein [Bacillus sp. Marseille-P3800]|uniref:hypothetical protein n=1 Tax=Bacillus sp. Marseille-P3800 TaxID=2014782 RepID=UPI000C0681F4|nr:hypothetical protein [Bacillus sp. Marseille-P3800]